MDVLSIVYKILLMCPYIILVVYTCMTGIVYLQSRKLEACEGYMMKTFWSFMCVIALLLCLFLTDQTSDSLFSSHLFFSLYFATLFSTCLIHEKIDLPRKLLLLGIVPGSLLFCFFIL